jgi:hypothetical protein
MFPRSTLSPILGRKDFDAAGPPAPVVRSHCQYRGWRSTVTRVENRSIECPITAAGAWPGDRRGRRTMMRCTQTLCRARPPYRAVNLGVRQTEPYGMIAGGCADAVPGPCADCGLAGVADRTDGRIPEGSVRSCHRPATPLPPGQLRSGVCVRWRVGDAFLFQADGGAEGVLDEVAVEVGLGRGRRGEVGRDRGRVRRPSGFRARPAWRGPSAARRVQVQDTGCEPARCVAACPRIPVTARRLQALTTAGAARQRAAACRTRSGPEYPKVSGAKPGIAHFSLVRFAQRMDVISYLSGTRFSQNLMVACAA